MGSYIYAETGKNLKVTLPDGKTIEAGVIEYVTKPYTDLWDCSRPLSFHSRQERQAISTYNRLRRKWAAMTPHKHVVQKFEDGTRFLYLWLDEPEVWFWDDATFGTHLVKVGTVDAKGNVQPLLMASKEVDGASCQLWVKWDRYFMDSSRTGTHSLAVNCTPPARLSAHWNGFLENQQQEVALG